MMRKIFLLMIFAIVSLQAAANPLVFGNSRITLITPTLFRIEYAQNGRFIDNQTMFAYERGTKLSENEYTVTPDGNDRYVITTSALRIEFWNNGYPFGESNLKVHYSIRGKKKIFTNRGIYNENMGAAVETLDKLSEAVPLHDGLLARSGWYIVDDEDSDLLVGGWIQPRNAPEHIQDQYCFVYGDNFKAALRDLGAIGGKIPLTRRYIHGVWFSRYWDYSASDFLKIVDEYDSNGFPLDNVVLDMGWHENDATTGIGGSGKLFWTGYDWNSALFPKPESFIKEMHSKGVTVSLNDHPHDGIRQSESCYPDFMKAMKAEKDSILLFNPADSNYMTNFFRFAHEPRIKEGVDFWWLDWQQNHIYRKVRPGNTSTLKWINELYSRDSQKQGLRSCTFSRWAGWGDHRHPVQFSGDAHITWPMLKFEIKLSSYSCGEGCYYWIHDTGGFKGTPDSEMNVRWTQFGATSAALRIHSTKKKELDRRPWLGSPEEVAALRKAYRLRSELMPYVYSSVFQAHSSMLPLNRPMFVEYPLSDEAFSVEQQYMFGDQLLCRPITVPGTGENKLAEAEVWFPAGELWYDWFSGEKIEGGRKMTVSKALDEFPLYQKGGWLLPMQPYSSRPALEVSDTIVLRVCPAASDCDNIYTLYEDDGVSMEYVRGRCRKTVLRYIQKGDRAHIEIREDGGNYNGKPLKRRYILKYLTKSGIWKSTGIKGSSADVRIN